MIWSVSTADKKFSEAIRARDPRCAYDNCGPSVDCSHFYERGQMSVRFDFENADGLARKCHQLFHANRTEYKLWKLKQLGTKAYMALQRKSAIMVKQDDAIISLMNLLRPNQFIGKIDVKKWKVVVGSKGTS